MSVVADLPASSEAPRADRLRALSEMRIAAHRSSTILIGMPWWRSRCRYRPVPAVHAAQPHNAGSTASRTQACSSCWRWASTSSSAWRACWTSATPRSSPSARTPTPTVASPFTSAPAPCPFWPMLLVGAGVAALFGILLGAPTLRLRGDYLAIVTLGFGEIVPLVFLNSDKFTNGTNGIGGLDRPALPILGGFSGIDPWPYYITARSSS